MKLVSDLLDWEVGVGILSLVSSINTLIHLETYLVKTISPLYIKDTFIRNSIFVFRIRQNYFSLTELSKYFHLSPIKVFISAITAFKQGDKQYRKIKICCALELE